MLRTPFGRLFAAAALAFALATSLSGCLIADNKEATIDDLGDPSIQDALDQTSDALADVSGALDSVQQDIANALNDVAGSLQNLADAPDALAELFQQDGIASKAQAVRIENAKTGETVAELTDAQDLKEVAASFARMDYVSWKVVASHPDAASAERTVVFSEDETIKLGQDPADVQTADTIRITTYENSNVIELVVVPLDFALDLELPASDIETIRAIANR